MKRSRTGGQSAVMRVNRNEAGMSLRDFLATRLDCSGRKAKQYIDRRRLWINSRCVWMAHHRLHHDDLVRLTGDGPEREQGQRAGPLPILTGDQDYLCVYKPAGIPSVGQDSVESRLQEQTRNRDIRAVHRLDRETSGCLLISLNQPAFAAAVKRFKSRLVHKLYHVIVHGDCRSRALTINLPIDEQRAITHIRCLSGGKEASLLLARIETGRTRQIRRHLAAIHHPVLGDRDHGRKRQVDPRMQDIPRTMLHASSLSLPHPLNESKVFKAHAPLPADFRHCLQIFGLGGKGARGSATPTRG